MVWDKIFSDRWKNLPKKAEKQQWGLYQVLTTKIFPRKWRLRRSGWPMSQQVPNEESVDVNQSVVTKL